ncbi:hypothetical protein V1514DRAFT_331835 [Lipomyces japonicus]|uniref:uncharacterized protein n=1 Tax=Lipomyces japonicus TaxID=56871 RepID=UPI0034CEA2B7
MTTSSYKDAIHNRDGWCQITAFRTETEAAHIIPSDIDGSSVIDDHANLVVLRADIHKAFDDRNFILYPKDNASYYVHMIKPSPNLGVWYHNAKSHPIELCRPQFLFARFSWTLFPLISEFLIYHVDKTVIEVTSNDIGIQQRNVVC